VPTSTPRLGLVKPLTSENYDVGVHNSNMDIIDSAPANLTICTSTTRPSSPDEGDEIFETDSGNFLIRQGAAWKPSNGRDFWCTAGTRPVAGLTYGGYSIIETTSGNRATRNSANTSWFPHSPYSVNDATEQSALGSPFEGLLLYRRDLNYYLRLDDNGSWVPIDQGQMLAHANRTTAGTQTTTALKGQLRVDSIPMIVNYQYWIELMCHPSSTVTSDAIRVDLLYSNSGAATEASPQIVGSQLFASPSPVFWRARFTPPSTGTYSFLVAVVRGGGSGSVNLYLDATNRTTNMDVFYGGPLVADTGVDIV
jgi:hypothetical protein